MGQINEQCGTEQNVQVLLGGLKNQGNIIIKIYYVIVGNLFSHQSNKNRQKNKF